MNNMAEQLSSWSQPVITSYDLGRIFANVNTGPLTRKSYDALVDALKAGSQLTVRGTSQRGTDTTDTYSLSGVTAAMAEIDKACA